MVIDVRQQVRGNVLEVVELEPVADEMDEDFVEIWRGD
jgi:hypothetical protein